MRANSSAILWIECKKVEIEELPLVMELSCSLSDIILNWDQLEKAGARASQASREVSAAAMTNCA